MPPVKKTKVQKNDSLASTTELEEIVVEKMKDIG